MDIEFITSNRDKGIENSGIFYTCIEKSHKAFRNTDLSIIQLIVKGLDSVKYLLLDIIDIDISRQE